MRCDLRSLPCSAFEAGTGDAPTSGVLAERALLQLRYVWPRPVLNPN